MLDRQELKNRGTHLNVSKFSASRGCSVIIALLFGGWGVGLIYLILIDHGMTINQLMIPVFIFAIGLVVGALALIRQTLKTPESHYNLSFNERVLLKKARIPSLLFLFFMIVFCSIFVGVGIYGGKTMFLIVGLFFLILIVVGGVYGLVKSEKRIKLTQTHGTTHLGTYSALSLGNTCEFILKNDSPDLQSKDLVISLRYIEEIYLSKQTENKEKSSTLKIFYSSEQQKPAFFENGKSMPVQFTFPNEGQFTDIDFQEPKYWELTCSSYESNYFSRFILDVRP